MLRTGALCLSALVLMPFQVRAWENTCSHPHITDDAVGLLNPSLAFPPNNYYIEFDLSQAVMESGATAEDQPDPTVVDHFYDPKTQQPLHDPSDSDNGHIIDAALLSTSKPPDTALGRGEFWWNKAISDYRFGLKNAAYVDIGHAVHLLTQDMTQPAHVHNDPHIPKVNFLQRFLSNPALNKVGKISGQASESSPRTTV